MPDLLAMGRVHGHRGRGGALTVRVAAGDAGRWSDVGEVWLQRGDDAAERFEVQHEKAYRDRWVLKLRGIEDSDAAERWRGAAVSVARDRAPVLGKFEHWHASLVGTVVLAGDKRIGTVRDIQPTAGSDLLVVESENGDEVLIPLHREIVVEVDESARTLRIDPPEGLLELNRESE